MQVSPMTESRPGRRIAPAFEQYVSGRRAIPDGTAFFLESGEHVETVLAVAEPDDVVFAPVGPRPHTDTRVIGYRGDFREPGSEMTLDGTQRFELQDYVAALFVSIVGPTVIRQGSAEGLAAFLSDADTARDSGVFVDQLLSRAVLLDSWASFIGEARRDDALVRVHVTADGEYRDGPDGLLLGAVGEERADIEARATAGAGRGRAFARIVDPAVLAADLDDRPWIARYAAAVDLLREWDGAPARPAISGFGGHLVRALDELRGVPGIVSADAPYLLTGDGEDYILVDPASRRRFRVDVDVARATECLIATGAEASATALLAAELRCATGDVAEAVVAIRARFAAVGIDLFAATGFAASGDIA